MWRRHAVLITASPPPHTRTIFLAVPAEDMNMMATRTQPLASRAWDITLITFPRYSLFHLRKTRLILSLGETIRGHERTWSLCRKYRRR
jgi:hypothetical protein